jgi:hypothetical protein
MYLVEQGNSVILTMVMRPVAFDNDCPKSRKWCGWWQFLHAR